MRSSDDAPPYVIQMGLPGRTCPGQRDRRGEAFQACVRLRVGRGQRSRSVSGVEKTRQGSSILKKHMRGHCRGVDLTPGGWVLEIISVFSPFYCSVFGSNSKFVFCLANGTVTLRSPFPEKLQLLTNDEEGHPCLR